MKLEQLPGLGPKSIAALNQIGLYTLDDLKLLGSVKTYLKLKQNPQSRLSLNMLYALQGAIEQRDWRQIAATQKSVLLMELDAEKSKL